MFLTKTRNISNLNRFSDEAKAHNSKIEYVLKFNDDELRFTITQALTAEEDLALDAFILAFDDSGDEDSQPIIYTIAKSEAKNKHFHNILFDREVESGKGLIPDIETGTVKGEVQVITWYKELDANSKPITPVVRESNVYTRENDFALMRVKTITWFNEDGSENPDVKVKPKYYFINRSLMIREGTKRRGLLVEMVQLPVMDMMAEVLMPLGVTQESIVLKGRHFLDEYELLFNNFVKHSSTITDPAHADFGKKVVVVTLRDEQREEFVEWLDKAPNSLGGSTTIRQYLMSEFEI